jgi:hypothetical protein
MTLLFSGERYPVGILVCDMPERKQLILRSIDLRILSQSPSRLSKDGLENKKWPRKTGTTNRGGTQVNAAALENSFHRVRSWKSETEIGKVAVAYHDAGVRHQQAIDGDHHSIEQVGGR